MSRKHQVCESARVADLLGRSSSLRPVSILKSTPDPEVTAPFCVLAQMRQPGCLKTVDAAAHALDSHSGATVEGCAEPRRHEIHELQLLADA
ncbi:hypothetical protein WJ93_07020 [Burkholderia ubonensis]|nr:hypothetical protein WJ93_07020 [Burkholderia ubonensis]